MNKKLLIFFRPHKFRDNDEIRFEIKNYNKKFDVHFVEIYDYLYEKKLFKNTKKLSKPIKSFRTLGQIIKYFTTVKKKYKEIYLINFIPTENYKSFKINQFIYSNLKFNMKIIEINNSGFPSKMINNYDKILLYNFRINEIIKKLKLKFFKKYFYYSNTHQIFLYAGKKKRGKFKKCKIYSISYLGLFKYYSL